MRTLPPPIGKCLLITALAILSSLSAFAQTIKVTGTVVDTSDEPLTGATVLVKGTQNGASTDFNGQFTLNAPSDGVLVVSYIGFATKEVKINGQQNLTIVLTENSTVLDEVVAIGYGTQKKVNMTGAVASVKTDALEDRPINDVTTALAGLAPGLAIRNTGGTTPGYSSIEVKVRGTGTLNNSAPLIVVDGVTGTSLSDINPQDIENISILKDAASSAIYGSRAANGVILITTKQGKEGTAKLSYSGNLSIETVATKMNIVSNYADFMEYQNQGLINNGSQPRFSQAKINEWRNDAGRNPRVYPNTDWQDYAYRDPTLVQTHNINISGGTSSIRYNMSVGMVHNPGMLNNTKYVRYQMRSNIEVDIKPWLTAGINVYGFMDKSSPSADNAASGGDAIFSGGGAINTVPGMNLYDKETGTYGGIQNPEEATVTNYNPYRRQWFWREDHPNQHKRFMPKMYLRIKPAKGLTIQGSYTYKFDYDYRNLIFYDKPLYRYVLEADGSVGLQTIYDGIARSQVRNYFYVTNFRTSDITADYNFKSFNDRLETNILLGASQEYQHYNYSASNKTDQPSYDQTTQDAGITLSSIAGNYNEWAMRSFFGRLNLVWDNKYMLEANVRTDGSSYFSPEHRWGWFPSVSAGWRISEENFMESTKDWMNSLKIRASYGSLGNNSGVNSYSWQSVYAANNYILGPGQVISGMAQTAISNYNLTWESTYVTNIGLDFGFLKNRLSGTLEWYNKDTKGILMSVPASLEHGTTTIPVTNAGRVNNKGVDFDIRWQDRIGKVSYNVGFNMGYVKNKLVDYGGEIAISGNYKYEEGKPIAQLYVMDVDRIVRNQADLDYVESLVEKNPSYFSTFTRPALGDFLYKDANGDGKLDYDDRIEVGHGTTPTFSFGINLGAQWNNFDIQMLLQGTGRHEVYYNNAIFRFVSQLGYTLNKDIVENQWTPENPNAKYPILRNNGDSRNQIASTAFVSDAAYLRCKNLQIGYTIPRSITQKFFVENLKVYTSIDNLFTITNFIGIDPEINYGISYPTVRQFSFGLNVSF